MNTSISMSMDMSMNMSTSMSTGSARIMGSIITRTARWRRYGK
jgi:hypothetical protein